MALSLVTVEEVVDAMGQNPDLMEDAKPAIASAISRAHIKLEALLKTTLSAQDVEDTFFVGEHSGEPLNNRYALWLSNGFVRAMDDISVSYCDTVDGTYSVVLNAVTSHKIGKVLIPCENTKSRYVKVTYSSGFKDGEEAPMEVQQAILCFTPSLIMSSASASMDPKQAAVAKARATTMYEIGEEMASSLLRPYGACIKPMYSTASPA